MSNLITKPDAAPEIPVVTPPSGFAEHPIVQLIAGVFGGIRKDTDDILFVQSEHSMGLCTSLQHYLQITLGEQDLLPAAHPKLFAELLIALTLTNHDPGRERMDAHWLANIYNRLVITREALELCCKIYATSDNYPHGIYYGTRDYLQSWQQIGTFEIMSPILSSATEST